MIGLDLKNTSSEALDAGKQAIIKALAGLYGEPPAGEVDFNNASAATVAANLTAADPPHLVSKGGGGEKRYRDLADALVSFRNSTPQSGLITNFQQVSAVNGVTPAGTSDPQD